MLVIELIETLQKLNKPQAEVKILEEDTVSRYKGNKHQEDCIEYVSIEGIKVHDNGFIEILKQ